MKTDAFHLEPNDEVVSLLTALNQIRTMIWCCDYEPALEKIQGLSEEYRELMIQADELRGDIVRERKKLVHELNERQLTDEEMYLQMKWQLPDKIKKRMVFMPSDFMMMPLATAFRSLKQKLEAHFEEEGQELNRVQVKSKGDEVIVGREHKESGFRYCLIPRSSGKHDFRAYRLGGDGSKMDEDRLDLLRKFEDSRVTVRSEEILKGDEGERIEFFTHLHIFSKDFFVDLTMLSKGIVGAKVYASKYSVARRVSIKILDVLGHT